MTEDELEKCRTYAWETWGLEAPDQIDIYHALRILRILAEKPVPSFDDFAIAMKRCSDG